MFLNLTLNVLTDSPMLLVADIFNTVTKPFCVVLYYVGVFLLL